MAELTFQVGEDDTALAQRSGDLQVLATPRLINWLEAATVAETRDQLEEGWTTVGYRVDVAHLLPSPVGEMVTVAATTELDDGRRLTYRVTAHDRAGRLVGQGEIKRARVQVETFMAGLTD